MLGEANPASWESGVPLGAPGFLKLLIRERVRGREREREKEQEGQRERERESQARLMSAEPGPEITT